MQNVTAGYPAVSRRFRFTEAKLASLPLATDQAARTDYTDEAAPWFVCRVGSTSRTLYVRRKQRGSGRLVFHRLGIVGERPLQAFRVEGEKIAAALSAGAAPETALASRGALTLQAALNAYVEAKGDKLAPLTLRSYRSDMEQTFGSWLARPLTALDAATVARLHRERSADSRTRADGALRVLRAVYRYATKAAEAAGKPLAMRDPLALITAAKSWNGAPRKSTRLDDVSRPQWLAAVRALPDDHGKTMSGTQRDAMLLLAATGLRLREGLRLSWNEIDFERATLTLAAERMKGARAHSLPIAKRTLAMLAARREAAPDSTYVFEGRGGDEPQPIDRISKATFAAIGVEATAHDLRRGIATWLAAHAPAFVVRAVLSHGDPAKSPDVTAGYVSLDVEALRGWLQQWEDALHGARAQRVRR